MASSTSASGAAPPDARAFVEQEVNAHKVVIFSKTYCPYSRRTKEVMASTGAHADIVELDQRPDGDAIQDALGQVTGASTVPRVFIGGRFYGDATKTVQQAAGGGLKEELRKVGALA